MASLLLIIGVTVLLIQPILILVNINDTDVGIKALFSASGGFVVARRS